MAMVKEQTKKKKTMVEGPSPPLMATARAVSAHMVAKLADGSREGELQLQVEGGATDGQEAFDASQGCSGNTS